MAMASKTWPPWAISDPLFRFLRAKVAARSPFNNHRRRGENAKRAAARPLEQRRTSGGKQDYHRADSGDLSTDR